MKSISNSTLFGLLFVFSAIVTIAVLQYTQFKPSIYEKVNLSDASTDNTEQTQSNTTIPSPSPTLIVEVPPSSKVLPGGTHTFQTFNNCGPASLSMTLSYYDQTVSQQTLGQALRPYQNPQGNNDDKSVTLAELATKAQEYGFTTYHRPGGNRELIQQFITYDIPIITRTWLEPGEDIGHYRVVKGYDQSTGQYIQDDSLQGKDLRYTYEEFDELWQAFNYEFLVLVPTDKTAVAEVILGELITEDIAWEQALNSANEQLSINPTNIYAHFNRSVALYELDRYQESITAFEAVEDQLPSRMLWYQIEPILAYYQVNNFARVMELSSTILNNHNQAFSELHYLRGLIYQTEGDQTQASQAFIQAEQYNSNNYWHQNLESVL